MIHFEFEPGDYVINPKQKDWGIGQVQSIIKNKITVNFQNQGKQVINGEIINLEKVRNESKWIKTHCRKPNWNFQ